MTDSTIVPGFVQKTYDIFMSGEHGNCCCWNQQGTSIIIKDIHYFSQYVLPKYFKHSNFQSFVRQLNMYDWHKVVQDPSNGEFKHPYFQRGREDLLIQIKRKVHLKPQIMKRKFETSSDDYESTNSEYSEEKNQLVLYDSKNRSNYDSINNKIRRLENQCHRLDIENIELRNIINESRNKQQLFFNQMENFFQIFYRVCSEANVPIVDSLAKSLVEQRKNIQIDAAPSSCDNAFWDESLADPVLNNLSRLSSLEDWIILQD